MRTTNFTLICIAGAIVISGSAEAKEYPVGTPEEKNGMDVAAVYLQPIEMEPADIMLPATESDVHLATSMPRTTIRTALRKVIGSPISRLAMN